MKEIKNWLNTYGLFVLVASIVFLMMEWIVRMEWVPFYILPAPTKVIQAIIENWHSHIFEHLSMTIVEVLRCCGSSVMSGVTIAVTMFYSNTVRKIMYPAILISQSIPIIALSPIFVLWFGYTIWSKVAVTVLISFFPVVVGTYDGLRSTDKEYIDLFRSMGAKKHHLFIKLHLPSALPSIFSGLKIAIVSALIGATVGEWLGANQGLGYYSRRMSGNLDAEGVFAAIILLSIAGIILFGFITLMEKHFHRWQKYN